MSNNTLKSGNVQQHPAALDMYMRHGWKVILIPHGSKAPTHQGWNREGGWIQDAGTVPPHFNMGLAHAYSGTMAVDVDDWQSAVTLLDQAGIDLQALYDAPDAVTIESGNPGHGKLLYRMPPFIPVQYSKKIILEKKNIIDFRCGTSANTTVQDVLPPSIHPETRQAYRWGGRGHWTRLPTIPPELLSFWTEQLTEPENTSSGPIDTDFDEIRNALQFIDPDCDRKTWIEIGMALHDAGLRLGNPDESYKVWVQWSQGTSEKPSKKFNGFREIRSQWNSFKADHGITAATLFGLAKEAGWERPIPNIEGLFENVDRPADLFAHLRPPPPAPNLDLFPPVLSRRANEIATSVGCDPLVPLWAALATVCGAVDSRTRLKMWDDFVVPPVLWCLVIGDPSDRKTPGSQPLFNILDTLEEEDNQRFAREHIEWEVKQEMYKQQHAAFIKEKSDLLNNLANDVQMPVPELEDEPVPLTLVVKDVTSQKLVYLSKDRPHGLLCYLDEMNGWVKKITTTDGTENRSTWVDGYAAGRTRMDRVGAGSITVKNFAVSIYGNMQPDVFRRSSNRLNEDGLLARFLPACLRLDYSMRLGEPIPDFLSNKHEYELMIRQVFGLPTMNYAISPEARDVFRDFQVWMFQRQRDDLTIAEENRDYKLVFGKLTGTVARLALVFHIVESPYSPLISGELMQRVVRIAKEFLAPSYRYVYAEIVGQLENSIDVWLASHILAVCGEVTEISVSEIKRSARRQLKDYPKNQQDVLIIDGMVTLEACQWVIPLPMKRGMRGQQPGHRWAINPSLKDVYADHRRRILIIKQKRLDETLKNIGTYAGKEIPRRLTPGYDPSWDKDLIG